MDAKQGVSVLDQLQRVHDAWNPQSVNCAFKHYFYNQVPPEQVGLYAMPQGQDPSRWERAVQARPNASCVPVLAVGFTDLEKRVKQQDEQVNAYRMRMHEINEKLVELSNRHDLHTTVKLLEMRERHAKLARRALQIAVAIQLLSNSGRVLSSQEELFQRQAQKMLQKVEDPSVYGSLSEAWARVKTLQERQRANRQKQPISSSGPSWEDDQENLELIVRILAAQQKGITYLENTLKNDTQTVNERLGLVPARPKQLENAAASVAPQAFATQVPQPAINQQRPLMKPANNTGFGQNSLFSSAAGANNGATGVTGANNGTGFGSLGSNLGTAPLGTNLGSSLGAGTNGGTGLGGIGANTAPAAGANTTGGLFGAKPAGTGLFGNTQAAPSNGLFGASKFGQTNNNTNNPTTGGTGLFGAQTQTQNPAPATGGGLFGSQQQTAQPATGGLFGQAGNTANNTGGTGGLFGNTNTNTNTGGSGLFGNNANTSATGTNNAGTGLFGNSFGGANNNANNANNANTANTGAFGAKTGTGFGTNTATTGFGAKTGTGFGASTGTGFGSTPSTGFGSTANTGASAFGANTGTGFGANANTGASTGFGGNNTAFGANNTGANTATSGFGASTNTGFGKPATGFGTNTTNTGFGANTANTGFGANTANTGFGANTANTGFGAKPATGFGAAANTGFGANTANTGFGANTANTGFGAANTGFGGANNNTGFGQSGFSFGRK